MITECLQNLSSGTCVHFVDESQQTNAITTLNTNQSITTPIMAYGYSV
jgi:hypothetical protein